MIDGTPLSLAVGVRTAFSPWTHRLARTPVDDVRAVPCERRRPQRAVVIAELWRNRSCALTICLRHETVTGVGAVQFLTKGAGRGDHGHELRDRRLRRMEGDVRPG